MGVSEYRTIGVARLGGLAKTYAPYQTKLLFGFLKYEFYRWRGRSNMETIVDGGYGKDAQGLFLYF